MLRSLSFALVLAVVVALVSFGCGGGGGGNPEYSISVSRLKAIDQGLMGYLSDNDDFFPPGAQWMDGLGPYVPDQVDFHSPAVKPPGYGYALSADLSGQSSSQILSPDSTISIFDSTDLARNAVASITTMPKPARYGSSNTIGYADGHVKDELGVNPSNAALYGESVRRINQLDTALLMYSSDNNDTLPIGAHWVDETLPYVRDLLIYRSPAIERRNPSQFGYAFETAISGIDPNTVDSGTTISLFDSTILTRNATSDLSTLPAPPRYDRLNTIVYLDGHARNEFGSNPTIDQLYSQSQTRLRQVNLALIEYASDNDEHLPLAIRWMDETLPYHYDSENYRSPLVERSNPSLFGFAFNIDLSGADLTAIAEPANTITLFDSSLLTRNAAAPTSTMPSPPRYGGRNTTGYADGHVP